MSAVDLSDDNSKLPAPAIVKVGNHVELELMDLHGRIEHLSLEIVDDQFADYEAGFLGASTPLARSILGQLVESLLSYRIGDLLAVRILAVAHSQALPDSNRAEQRQEIIDKAIADSDRTNALLFASSFSGKWGDYDPASIEAWDEVDSSSEDNLRNE
jgi:hypothetical protein